MNLLSHLNRCALLPVLLLAAVGAQAAGLPDTGQIRCSGLATYDSVPASDPASISRDAGSYPRQDCRYGRDAAEAAGLLPKVGAGAKGLDYTKIANNGSVLAANAALGSNSTDWACTRDNNTGLTWEIKTAGGLRNLLSTYTWYSTNNATNGGNAGDNSVTNTCSGTLASCNTQDFVSAVNAGNGLCSANDWRMPTLRELQTLALVDGSQPAIDSTYFPNSGEGGGGYRYWSSSTWAFVPAWAYVVDYTTGGLSRADFKVDNDQAPSRHSVRLVRGAQF